MTLRELRLWHWRAWMRLREVQRAFPYGSWNWKFYERQIAPHVSAVQCLNDHCEGTAETDEALACGHVPPG